MKKTLLILSIFLFYGCPSDDMSDDEQAIEYNCCGENPFESNNVDNLNQDSGKIIFEPFFTPNNDGYNDNWSIRNLSFYSNTILEIFNSNNQSILLSNNFGQSAGWDGNNLEDGVYRYKLVIENENTYLQQGYFCLISTIDTELLTSKCEIKSIPDPIIDYN